MCYLPHTRDDVKLCFNKSAVFYNRVSCFCLSASLFVKVAECIVCEHGLFLCINAKFLSTFYTARKPDFFIFLCFSIRSVPVFLRSSCRALGLCEYFNYLFSARITWLLRAFLLGFISWFGTLIRLGTFLSTVRHICFVIGLSARECFYIMTDRIIDQKIN